MVFRPPPFRPILAPVKILFDHPDPFFLAHGGFQTQIEQTKAALEQIGVEVEYLRWWDEGQSGDLIHFFGRPTGGYIDFAHQKGLKVVVAELHTGLGSRGPAARRIQKTVMEISRRTLPSSFTARLAWDSYRKADAFVALTNWEAFLIQDMFHADPGKVHVVPNGVEEFFFKSQSSENRSDFLVCTATVTARKRVLELAEAAVLAQIPLWVIGRPYSENDPYHLRFSVLQKKNPGILRYEGGISDRVRLAEIYHQARGFTLLSSMESLSLSSLEAAAAGCPLLLSDLPWARSTFDQHASYCPIGNTKGTAACLKSFYNQASLRKPAFKPLLWKEVGALLRSIYGSVLVAS